MKLKKINIMELLAVITIFINTFALLLMQNAISYELQDTFEPVQKRSIIVILQHNPVIGYVYLFCGAILICSGIKRLYGSMRER